MDLLLNLLLGLLAGLITDYVLGRVGVLDPFKVIVAVIVGVIIFLAHLA